MKIKVEDWFIDKVSAKKANATHLGWIYYFFLLEGKSRKEFELVASKFSKKTKDDKETLNIPVSLNEAIKQFQYFSNKHIKGAIDFKLIDRKDTQSFLLNSLKYIEDIPECFRLINFVFTRVIEIVGEEVDNEKTYYLLFYLFKDFRYLSWSLFLIANFEKQKSSLNSKVNIHTDELNAMKTFISVVGEVDNYNIDGKFIKIQDEASESAESIFSEVDSYLTYEYLEKYLKSAKGSFGKEKSHLALKSSKSKTTIDVLEIWKTLSPVILSCSERLSISENTFCLSQEASVIIDGVRNARVVMNDLYSKMYATDIP